MDFLERNSGLNTKKLTCILGIITSVLICSTYYLTMNLNSSKQLETNAHNINVKEINRSKQDKIEPFESKIKEETTLNLAHISNQSNTSKFSTYSDITKRQGVLLVRAFFDDRNGINSVVYLYTINSFHHKSGDVVACLFRINHTKSLLTVTANFRELALYKLNGRIRGTTYTKYMYKCSSPAELEYGTNATVSLMSEYIEAYSNGIAVFYPEHVAKPVHLFGVCVPSAFGVIRNSQADALVEWFEFHRLLGVTQFNVYKATLFLEEKIKTIFRYYAQLGVLKLHTLPLPVSLYNEDDSMKNCQTVTRRGF